MTSIATTDIIYMEGTIDEGGFAVVRGQRSSPERRAEVERAVLAVLRERYTRGRFAGTLPVFTAREIARQIDRRNWDALVASQPQFAPYIGSAEARRVADELVRRGLVERHKFRDMKATVHYRAVEG